VDAGEIFVTIPGEGPDQPPIAKSPFSRRLTNASSQGFCSNQDFAFALSFRSRCGSDELRKQGAEIFEDDLLNSASVQSARIA